MTLTLGAVWDENRVGLVPPNLCGMDKCEWFTNSILRLSSLRDVFGNTQALMWMIVEVALMLICSIYKNMPTSVWGSCSAGL